MHQLRKIQIFGFYFVQHWTYELMFFLCFIYCSFIRHHVHWIYFQGFQHHFFQYFAKVLQMNTVCLTENIFLMWWFAICEWHHITGIRQFTVQLRWCNMQPMHVALQILCFVLGCMIKGLLFKELNGTSCLSCLSMWWPTKCKTLALHASIATFALPPHDLYL